MLRGSGEYCRWMCRRFSCGAVRSGGHNSSRSDRCGADKTTGIKTYRERQVCGSAGGRTTIYYSSGGTLTSDCRRRRRLVVRATHTLTIRTLLHTHTHALTRTLALQTDSATVKYTNTRTRTLAHSHALATELMTPKHEPQKQMESAAAARSFDRRYARACAWVFRCVSRACVRDNRWRRELQSSRRPVVGRSVRSGVWERGGVGASRRIVAGARFYACGNTATPADAWRAERRSGNNIVVVTLLSRGSRHHYYRTAAARVAHVHRTFMWIQCIKILNIIIHILYACVTTTSATTSQRLWS